MQTLTQLADAVVAAQENGSFSDEQSAIAALIAGVRAAELSPATEQSGEAVALSDAEICTMAKSNRRMDCHIPIYSFNARELSAFVRRIVACSSPQPAPVVPEEWLERLLRRAIDVVDGLDGMKLPGAMPVRVEKLRALLAAAPQPAQQPPSVIEEIAQQWDGCIYDSPSGDIDIGWAIRAAGKRLVSEQQPKEGGAQ